MKKSKKITLRHLVMLLLLVSICIYIAQLIIFRDGRNTAFYIFQDFAFLPVSIALATLVVGEIIDEHDKKQQIEKTRMLTSSFFTEFGAKLMAEMLLASECKEKLQHLHLKSCETEAEVAERQEIFRNLKLKLKLDEASYDGCMSLLVEHQTNLLIIASNPALYEHEEFTELLWGIFHLLDEYRLRGDYNNLSKTDVEHMNQDFAKVLKLLLINWVSNAYYLKNHYPNFYMTARKMAEAHREEIIEQMEEE